MSIILCVCRSTHSGDKVCGTSPYTVKEENMRKVKLAKIYQKYLLKSIGNLQYIVNAFLYSQLFSFLHTPEHFLTQNVLLTTIT